MASVVGFILWPRKCLIGKVGSGILHHHPHQEELGVLQLLPECDLSKPQYLYKLGMIILISLLGL